MSAALYVYKSLMPTRRRTTSTPASPPIASRPDAIMQTPPPVELVTDTAISELFSKKFDRDVHLKPKILVYYTGRGFTNSETNEEFVVCNACRQEIQEDRFMDSKREGSK